MSNLTERLAAKLGDITEVPHTVASIVVGYLPLLLSEPGLVAGLAPEVKREVLNQMVSANYRDAVSRGDKMEALVWLNALNYTAQVSP